MRTNCVWCLVLGSRIETPHHLQASPTHAVILPARTAVNVWPWHQRQRPPQDLKCCNHEHRARLCMAMLQSPSTWTGTWTQGQWRLWTASLGWAHVHYSPEGRPGRKNVVVAIVCYSHDSTTWSWLQHGWYRPSLNLQMTHVSKDCSSSTREWMAGFEGMRCDRDKSRLRQKSCILLKLCKKGWHSFKPGS